MSQLRWGQLPPTRRGQFGLTLPTLPANGFPGLSGPQDVYEVLAALTGGAQGLAQLAFHLTEYLARELGAGRIGVNYGRYDGDPLGATSEAVNALTAAGGAADHLQAALSRVWSATSGMAARDPATDSRDQDDDRASDGDGG